MAGKTLEFGEILPEPRDPEEKAEIQKLRRFVHQFREGHSTTGVLSSVEPHDEPIDVSPNWVPPEFQLLNLQKATGRKVLGLGVWHAESDGHVVENLALPLLERSDKNR